MLLQRAYGVHTSQLKIKYMGKKTDSDRKSLASKIRWLGTMAKVKLSYTDIHKDIQSYSLLPASYKFSETSTCLP